jgi:DNA polymerase (family 10)
MAQKWRSPKVRRPREQVQPFVDLLTEQMIGVEFQLLGSWRRGAPTVGDLDVLIVTPSGEMSGNLFDQDAVELPASFRAQRRGPKVAQGDLVLPSGDSIHLDVWSCRPNERGAYLMFATGPMQLNLAQRSRAIKLGYALSQVGLLRDGVQVDDGTEESIYRLLDWPWLSPADRQKWADPR